MQCPVRLFRFSGLRWLQLGRYQTDLLVQHAVSSAPFQDVRTQMDAIVPLPNKALAAQGIREASCYAESRQQRPTGHVCVNALILS